VDRMTGMASRTDIFIAIIVSLSERRRARVLEAGKGPDSGWTGGYTILHQPHVVVDCHPGRILPPTAVFYA
jgi:hypothetical protein